MAPTSWRGKASRHALRGFQEGDYRVLVATDVAARGTPRQPQPKPARRPTDQPTNANKQW